MAAVDDATLQAVVDSSTYKSKYSVEVDGESAYEQLVKVTEQEEMEEAQAGKSKGEIIIKNIFRKKKAKHP